MKQEIISSNHWMSKKYKKFCNTLNYIEHFLILTSMVTGCMSIFIFASLLGIPTGITSSALRLKISAITAGNKMYRSIVKKKKKKKHDKIVLIEKSKSNSIENLISRALIDSNISHD